MKFGELVHKSCEKSSIHGIPYLVNPKLHLLEKFFWFAIIISASYFSITVCLNQWRRFRDNPILYALELSWNRNDFPYAGITLCADYRHEQDDRELIERFWGQQQGTPRYQYYYDFLGVLNVLRYDTLFTLEPYANDLTLANIDFVDILLSMQKRLMPPPPKNILVQVKKPPTKYQSAQELENRKQIYAAAITEAGLCRTVSQLSEYTNPYGELNHLPVSDIIYCGFMSECNTKIFPMIGDSQRLIVYLHNSNDIVAPNDRSSIMREAQPDSLLFVELLVSWTGAEEEVRNLPIAFRKCRYPDENYLRLFKIYRPGLCRIECRINAALKLCQCKPFFYAVAPKAPVCDIKGMLCLVAHNWTETKCNCMKLCEELSYTSTLSSQQKDDITKYERTILVKLSLPRMSLKRQVVFSTDQLIVSFGGAIGLFLGASFISIFEMVFAIGEYCGMNMAKCFHTCSLRKNKVHTVKPI